MLYFIKINYEGLIHKLPLFRWFDPCLMHLLKLGSHLANIGQAWNKTNSSI